MDVDTVVDDFSIQNYYMIQFYEKKMDDRYIFFSFYRKL